MAIIVIENAPPQQVGETVAVRPTFNFLHFKTPHGALLILQFVIGIVLMSIGAPTFVTILAWLAWILTDWLVIIYLFSLNERYVSTPPLFVMEFYFNIGTTVLYLLFTVICFITLSWVSAVFTSINTAAYGAAAFLLFKDWQTYRQTTLPK